MPASKSFSGAHLVFGIFRQCAVAATLWQFFDAGPRQPKPTNICRQINEHVSRHVTVLRSVPYFLIDYLPVTVQSAR